MDISCYLGIDGGATKTDYALCDRDGRVLRRTTGEPTNPFDCGFETAAERLRAGICAICGEIPLSSVSAFAGLSGGATAGTQKRFADFFAGLGFGAVRNGSDMQNAVAAALGKNDGICAVVGTGSVVCTQRNGETHRFGGYGYFFDDTLSGFDLGRRALAAVLRAAEGTGPRTLLSESCDALCGGPVREHLNDIYARGKTFIASFAGTVFDAAEKDDPVAARILQEQTQKLGETLLAADRDFSSPFERKIALIGGLCKRENLLAPLLAPLFPLDTVIFSEERQVTGALLLAGAPTERTHHA